MHEEVLFEQFLELRRKNAALLELSLVYENASLAHENLRLMEQNALLKINNAANPSKNFIPSMPIRAPPGLAPPFLQLANTPEMSHVMPPHGLVSPALGHGYDAAEHHDQISYGHQPRRRNTKSAMSHHSRLATAASGTLSSSSNGSSEP